MTGLASLGKHHLSHMVDKGDEKKYGRRIRPKLFRGASDYHLGPILYRIYTTIVGK